MYKVLMPFLINRMLSQLTEDVRMQFPAILTHKYTCDLAIIALLRSRTLGNSPTLRNNIREIHFGEWLKKQLVYMSACERHK